MQRYHKVRLTILLLCLLMHSLTCTAEKLDLARYKGKVVYMDFWASWCNPCLKSFPWMNNLAKKFEGKNFIIITINVDTDPQLAHQFLKSHAIKAKTFFDTNNTIATQFNVRAMPSSFLYNAEGEMVEKYSGFNEKKAKLIEEKIIKLLN